MAEKGPVTAGNVAEGTGTTSAGWQAFDACCSGKNLGELLIPGSVGDRAAGSGAVCAAEKAPKPPAARLVGVNAK